MNDKTTLFKMYSMLNTMQSQLDQYKAYLENVMDEKGYDYSTILEDYDVAMYDNNAMFDEKLS